VGGFLEWEDEHGKPLLHPDARLADLLRPRGLRAVLLHGCDTAVSDRHDDLNGVAGALIGAGIPAVVAQQFKLTYQSSQEASRAFYTALAAGLDISDAVFEVRLSLQQNDRPDWTAPIVRTTISGLSPLLDPAAPSGPADPALTQPIVASGLPA